MIKRRTSKLLGLIILISSSVAAQDPTEILDRWSATSPIEKAYLQFDRENYIAGERIWFKGYLVSDFYPDTISTTLYVELLQGSRMINEKIIVPVFGGTARGHLTLPDSLATGQYTVRAYTATMLNNPEEFVFRHNIFIYGSQPKGKINTVAPRLSIEFFPEGGNMLTGVTSAVAFKATNERGLPVDIKGKLFDASGVMVSAVTSYHDGMGMFEVKPAIAARYYLMVDGDEDNKFYLPDPTDKTISLTITSTPRWLSFAIQQPSTDKTFEAAYIVGQIQHHIVFRQELPAGKKIVQGRINTDSLNSGILQITVFNKAGIPLAERLSFINNKEYIQHGELIVDTMNFSGKGRNRFSLFLKDTVIGNFSVSVTDPAFDVSPLRESSIYASLLLTSDIKGYVHNPNWYFTADSDSARNGVDLVMLTNGWRRFNWVDLTREGVPVKKYNDLSFITLSGKVNLWNSKKVVANNELMMLINNADSTSTVQLLNTDENGYFRLDSMFFWGRNKLLFSDPKGRKGKLIEVTMSPDSLSRPFSFREHLDKFTLDPAIATQSRWKMDYDLIRKESGLMLEGITVKAKRKKTPLEEVESKYVGGMFTGPSDHVIDLVNSREALNQQNIFEYLRGRVPAINVTSAGSFGTDYQLFYRGGGTMSLRGPIPMLLYLNEMPIDANTLATIRPDDVALIKVYSHFAGAPGNGVGGVLSIYTKSSEDRRKSTPPSGHQVTYNGYTVYKEFYSPDYDIEPEARKIEDKRITLQWQPDIYISDVDARIPIVFYNSDRARQFKVIIEGMTKNGKMLMIEKIITGKSGF